MSADGHRTAWRVKRDRARRWRAMANGPAPGSVSLRKHDESSMTTLTFRKPSALPGFGLTLGFTVAYLSLIVLIPLAATFAQDRDARLGRSSWRRDVAARAGVVSADVRRLARRRADQRGVRLSGRVGAGALHVSRSSGSSTRWSTCRSRCPRRSPASRSTALYAGNGWIGQFLEPLGIKVAFTPLGRTGRADLHRPAVRRAHGAAGARRLRARAGRGGRVPRRHRAGRRSARVILPSLFPALLTGFALAFARALGEYGSVIFIAGNMPMKSGDHAAADHHASSSSTTTRAPRRSRS